MGADKAFLKLDGRTLLETSLRVLSEACGGVTIVGDPAKLEKYGRVVADVYAGCGPLAGIHTALEHSSTELNVMLAVDMPFVSAKLLSFLLGKAEKSDAAVTVPRMGRGLQPLCAVYRQAFAPIAQQALEAGKYKIDAAFAGVNVQVVDEPELTAAGFSGRNFLNVNTPEDWRAAEGVSFQP